MKVGIDRCKGIILSVRSQWPVWGSRGWGIARGTCWRGCSSSRTRTDSPSPSRPVYRTPGSPSSCSGTRLDSPRQISLQVINYYSNLGAIQIIRKVTSKYYVKVHPSITQEVIQVIRKGPTKYYVRGHPSNTQGDIQIIRKGPSK